MKRSRGAIVLGALFGAVAIATSCGFFQGPPKIEKFVVTVDSIIVADTVNVADTLFVGLRGIISTDGCGSFDSYVRERTGGTIKYTVYGLRDDSKLCVGALVLLRKTDTVLGPQVNPTTVDANNPPGSFPVSRTVVVK